MPYIGNNLATQFQAFATQTITGDGSTGYTLDRAVANGKELLVYINNVKQEEGSGKSYTASGTTITFSEAVASGDSCYLVYMGSAQQTVVPPDSSVTNAKLNLTDLTVDTDTLKVDGTNDRVLINTTTAGRAAEGADQLTIEAADDGHSGLTIRSGSSSYGTINFSDSAGGAGEYQASIFILHGTDTLTFATAGVDALKIDSSGHITQPQQSAFLVTKNAAQTGISVNQNVLIEFDTERFDQNGDFGSNTFTAPVTGRYQLNAIVYTADAPNDLAYFTIRIITSNRDYYAIFDPGQAGLSGANAYHTLHINVLADMDANDTAYVNCYTPSGSSTTKVDGSHTTSFSGFLAC